MNPSNDAADVRRRIHGCWLGKAVGGTLGQSFEGLLGPLAATFYDPVPTEMEPNDDLDLQVVWACSMARSDAPRVSRGFLARAWLEHVGFPFNEYGVAIRNLREGLLPPESGSHDNWFINGEGAAIRTELWACVAYGDPALAALYAYEDACVDHAGDGIHAAQFLAAAEAAAFSTQDVNEVLDAGLTQIPADSGVAQSVTLTRTLVAEGLPWREVRARLVAEFANTDFTDVRVNTGFVVLGLLAGRDFGERILICNNCGYDTDSSTASLGALLGILDPDGIPEKWLKPIGERLLLRPEIVGVDHPATLSEFTDLVVDLEKRIARVPPGPAEAGPALLSPILAESAFTDAYARHAFMPHGFLPATGAPAPHPDLEPIELPGTWARVPRADFTGDLLFVRYRLLAPKRGRYGLMVNCTEQMRVWLDDEYRFGRDIGGMSEPGLMWPAPHVPPLHQYAQVELDGGSHELLIALRRPPLPRDAEWVVALTFAESHMWVPGAFERRGVELRHAK